MKKNISFFLKKFIVFLFTIIVFTYLLPLSLVMRIFRKLEGRPNLPRTVYIGIAEIANNIGSLEHILSQRNIRVLTGMHIKNKFYSNTTVQRKNTFFYRLACIKDLITAIASVDQVWLVTNLSFLSFNLDYILLKLSGVDFVILHCGSEVRCPFFQDVLFQQFPEISFVRSYKYPKNKRIQMISSFYRQFMAEKFAKTISIRNQATFQMLPLFIFFFYQKPLVSQPKKCHQTLKIIHAPSDRIIKNTPRVLEAVELLKSRGVNFTFELIENMKNDELLKKIIEADIIVDEPSSWIGRLGTEGAAASCAVIAGSCAKFDGYPPSPFLQFPATAEELADIITDLDADRAKLNLIMAASWQYWLENYSEDAFWRKFTQLWNNTYTKFSPLPQQRKIFLAAATDWFEKLFIFLFYHPKA